MICSQRPSIFPFFFFQNIFLTLPHLPYPLPTRYSDPVALLFLFHASLNILVPPLRPRCPCRRGCACGSPRRCCWVRGPSRRRRRGCSSPHRHCRTHAPTRYHGPRLHSASPPAYRDSEGHFGTGPTRTEVRAGEAVFSASSRRNGSSQLDLWRFTGEEVCSVGVWLSR